MLLTLKKFFFHPAFIFVILFSCIAGFALLHPGLPPTHDGEYHVIRFYEFDKTLRGGNWYPRWAPDLNNGYGVPLFNYVYPWPNYVSFVLHLFGISFIDAFKLNMFFATIIGGIFFYLWTKRFWGEIGGVVSSIFFTFSPYRFVDIYIRGSIGEVWALAFFPAFLWSLTVFLQEKKTKFIVLAGVFLALIIFSHNILAVMFLPFALSYVLFVLFLNKKKLYTIRYTLYAIFLGLSLSAIFWLPALWEKQYVTGLQIYDVKANFPQLYQLLIPSWGSGFSGQNLEKQMSFQIGLANLLAVVLSFGSAIIFFKKKAAYNLRVVCFFIIWFTLVFFLMLKASLSIWQKIPLMDYFQFPWRLLSLEILICSFLVGSIISIFQNKIFAAILVFFVLLLGIGYAQPAYYHQRDDMYYISRSNFIDGTNSAGNVFNTIWMNKVLKREKEKIKIVKGSGIITDQNIDSVRYRFKAETKTSSEFAIHTAYFPGWKVFVDRKETKVINKEGIISFSLPPGGYFVEVQFLDTMVRQIGKGLSIVSIISFVVLYIRIKLKQSI